MGLEPMTSGAARRRADQVALCPSFNGLVLPLQCETGRDGRVRTDGLMHPMHARYQRLRYAPNVLLILKCSLG